MGRLKTRGTSFGFLLDLTEIKRGVAERAKKLRAPMRATAGARPSDTPSKCVGQRKALAAPAWAKLRSSGMVYANSPAGGQ